MNKSIALALLAGGIVLAVFGVSEMNSFTSDISRMFTGVPTNRSIWMLVGGAVMGVLGVAGMVQGSRRN
jgi:hypothetical protein